MYQPAPKVRGHATLVHLVYIEGEMLAVAQNLTHYDAAKYGA